MEVVKSGAGKKKHLSEPQVGPGLWLEEDARDCARLTVERLCVRGRRELTDRPEIMLHVSILPHMSRNYTGCSFQPVGSSHENVPGNEL